MTIPLFNLAEYQLILIDSEEIRIVEKGSIITIQHHKKGDSS
jgi:hypothetical protein